MIDIEMTLNKLFSKYPEYIIEAILEKSVTSRIRMRGKHIEDVSKSINNGGHFRVYLNNKIGFISFNDFTNIDEYLSKAIKISDYKNSSNHFIIRNPIVNYEETKIEDEISLGYKLKIIKKYNDQINNLTNVDSTFVTYGDSLKKKHYFNSLGSRIIQYKNDLVSSFTAVKKEMKRSIIYPLTLGSAGDFSVIEKAEKEIIDFSYSISRDNNYDSISPGKYPVVLDPILAGTFVHEILGHTLEADSLFENNEYNKFFKIGSKISSELLTLEDRPDLLGYRGSYKYDDEGIEGKGTILIKKGILKSFLHNRETSEKYNCDNTGNARIVNYRFVPIVRMSNCFIKPGKSSLAEMIESIDYGIFALGWKGAKTDINNFVIFPREAYMILNGKVGNKIDGLYFTGNIKTFLNIVKIGKDETINQGTSCSKYNQRQLPVSMMCSSIKIAECEIRSSL